jgi:HTH-type transcriptional regulator/antitoxin HigA
MAAKTTSRTLPDSYFALVKRFPLIHIRDESHLRDAQEFIDNLLKQDRDEGEEEYLDALTDLVETFEGEQKPISDASGSDVLRELMATNRMSQSTLAKAVGISQSTLSAVLSGKRSLTIEHMTRLSRFFHVAPEVFLPVISPGALP